MNNMDFVLIMGIFMVSYGIAGLLGYQVIPTKFKDHSWTPEFICMRGIGWLMVGIPWVLLAAVDLLVYRFADGIWLSMLIVNSLPGMLFFALMDRQYAGRLNEG